MGLLDDAIRDHLELKRRRGADPSEVERAEQEALGPVRRQPEADEEADYSDEMAGSADEPGVGEHDLPYGHELASYEDELDPNAGWHDPVPGPAADERPLAPSTGAGRSAREEESSQKPDPGVDTKPHAAVRPEQGDPEPVQPDHPDADHVRAHRADPERPPPAPPGRVHQATEEYDVEGENRAADHREDVLEETPEFLQDTPDHDRLWFEQRPPKDFNFDS